MNGITGAGSSLEGATGAGLAGAGAGLAGCTAAGGRVSTTGAAASRTTGEGAALAGASVITVSVGAGAFAVTFEPDEPRDKVIQPMPTTTSNVAPATRPMTRSRDAGRGSPSGMIDALASTGRAVDAPLPSPPGLSGGGLADHADGRPAAGVPIIDMSRVGEGASGGGA